MLGFNEAQAQAALEANGGVVERAANWLFEGMSRHLKRRPPQRLR